MKVEMVVGVVAAAMDMGAVEGEEKTFRPSQMA